MLGAEIDAIVHGSCFGIIAGIFFRSPGRQNDEAHQNVPMLQHVGVAVLDSFWSKYFLAYSDQLVWILLVVLMGMSLFFAIPCPP